MFRLILILTLTTLFKQGVYGQNSNWTELVQSVLNHPKLVSEFQEISSLESPGHWLMTSLEFKPEHELSFINDPIITEYDSNINTIGTIEIVFVKSNSKNKHKVTGSISPNKAFIGHCLFGTSFQFSCKIKSDEKGIKISKLKVESYYISAYVLR